MSVDADVFGARLADEQHVRPGAGGYGHAQAAETGAAAVALIPNHQIDKAHAKRKEDHHGDGVAKIVRERRKLVRLEFGVPLEMDAVRKAKRDCKPGGPDQQSGARQLGQQIAPILHEQLDSSFSLSVPGLLRIRRASASEQAAGKEHDIRRALRKPPHKIWIPGIAIGNIKTQTMSTLHQALLQIAADAVQHLKFKTIGRDVSFLRVLEGLIDRSEDRPAGK